jgi:hypothetical protein
MLLLLLPLAGLAQQPDYSYNYHKPQTDSIPWTHGLTVGFSIWPLTKERLRMGYSWEHRHRQYWHLELAYINAVASLWDSDTRHGTLEGGQLRAEYRFYETTGRNTFFYYGPSLAYMFSRHQYKSSEGLECNEWGDCAYFREVNEPVPAHSTTASFNLGWIVQATPTFHFNFFGGLGLQHTYFPNRKTNAFFGKHQNFTDSESTILAPRIRLGVNLHFALRQRNS